MRRGISQRLLRRAGRALRHGLVVAGVCMLIALATALSGYAFGERPEPAYGQAPPATQYAATSTEVLGRWLKPFAEPAAPAPDLLAPDPARPLPFTVETVSMPVPTPQPEEAWVKARLNAAPVELRPGDRTVVTLSFYYCEEAAGGLVRGDGGGFCGIVRDGSRVRPGVAACDVAYLGQRFTIEGDPTGRTYVCADTGSAVHGLHRDIWFLDNRDGWLWQRAVGEHAVIEILP